GRRDDRAVGFSFLKSQFLDSGAIHPQTRVEARCRPDEVLGSSRRSTDKEKRCLKRWTTSVLDGNHSSYPRLRALLRVRAPLVSAYLASMESPGSAARGSAALPSTHPTSRWLEQDRCAAARQRAVVELFVVAGV